MSKIIIDEIQGFDAKLFADLVYGLEFLSSYGTKILITTATLPPYLRDLLFKNISFNYQTFINNDIKRHNLKVLDDKLSAKDVYEHYLKYKKKHLVICNTIKKAKEILLEQEIEILISLGNGEGEAVAWGCDLTYDYVKINGDYRT